MDAPRAAALGLAAAAAWAALRLLLKVARAGSGYKAKVACSALNVSGLPLDVNSSPEISSEAYRPLRLFRARVLPGGRAVTASLLGLGRRTAAWRPGAGAALSGPGEPSAVSVPPPAAPAAPLRRAAASPAALAEVVADAFREPDPQRTRRTRAVVVLKDGAVVAERYAPGVSETTPLPGWSMAKSVTGALAGIAVGRGMLRLDQKSLLSEWAGDARSDIRFEDLLRMRSGLRFAEKYGNPASDVVQMLFALDDAAGYAASRPLAHPPGTYWQYASGTTNIVSLILRRALGADYHAFPRKALFDPAGMESAVFETDAAGTFVGSSFLFATARDWARFGQFCLEGGPGVLPEGWTRFWSTPTPQAPPGVYGAHWWLKLQAAVGGGTPEAERLPADCWHALGHEGQCLTVIPSRGLVAVRLGLTIRLDAWNHAAFLARVLDAF